MFVAGATAPSSSFSHEAMSSPVKTEDLPSFSEVETEAEPSKASASSEVPVPVASEPSNASAAFTERRRSPLSSPVSGPSVHPEAMETDNDDIEDMVASAMAADNAGLRAQPPAAPVADEPSDDISDEPVAVPADDVSFLLATATHAIIKVPSKASNNAIPMEAVMDGFNIVNVDKQQYKQRMYVGLRIPADGASLDEVADVVLAKPDIFGGATKLPDGSIRVLMKKPRGSATPDIFQKIPDAVCTAPTFPIGGGKKFNILTVDIFRSFLLWGTQTICNYEVKERKIEDTEAILNQLLLDFDGYSMEAVDLALARAKCTEPKTEKDKVLVKCHPQLVSIKKRRHADALAASLMKRNTDNPNIPDYNTLDAFKSMMCWTIDTATGETITFTIDEWLRDARFVKLCLVLHGNANLGKTPGAEALARKLAMCYAEDDGEVAYFLKVGTVDSLRKMQHYLASSLHSCLFRVLMLLCSLMCGFVSCFNRFFVEGCWDAYLVRRCSPFIAARHTDFHVHGGDQASA